MTRKREPEVEKENNERWLLTYSDLITLLMIFFVVLYSISQVDATKFRAIADSLSEALNGGTPAKIELNDRPSGLSIFATNQPPKVATTKSNTTTTSASITQNNQPATNLDSSAAQESLSIEEVKAKLDKFAADNGLNSQIESTIEERGLVISIQDTILFPSGSAQITPFAQNILDKISVVLDSIPNYIHVEGHTDNVPIHTSEFNSNWELSVIRATNVLQILVSQGIPPSRLSAEGYGEYRPIATNSTEAGRAKNRRVDLVVLRSKYDVTEPGQN